jgi:hypothetical protein
MPAGPGRFSAANHRILQRVWFVHVTTFPWNGARCTRWWWPSSTTGIDVPAAQRRPENRHVMPCSYDVSWTWRCAAGSDCVPVSIMWALKVMRSTIAATKRGSGKTAHHSLNGRLLASPMLALSPRSVMIWTAIRLRAGRFGHSPPHRAEVDPGAHSGRRTARERVCRRLRRVR